MSSFKTSQDIKVGVIGYGGAFNMGRQHLTFMKKAGMTPVAVAELDETRLKVAQEEFPGIETYTSVSAMQDKSDVNLVVIITPHNTHAELALQCLRAGRHVISEKPLAITTEECDAMISEAAKQNLLLSTYHNRHWDGCVLKALEQIHQRKVIGEVYRIEAHMGDIIDRATGGAAVRVFLAVSSTIGVFTFSNIRFKSCNRILWRSPDSRIPVSGLMRPAGRRIPMKTRPRLSCVSRMGPGLISLCRVSHLRPARAGSRLPGRPALIFLMAARTRFCR